MSRVPFEYALLRAVPRADRGECVNVGVVVWCQDQDVLAAGAHIDDNRLRALDAGLDIDTVRAAVDAVRAVCAGDPAAGPAAATAKGARFRWLVAPRSTVVRASAVHTGMTDDAAAEVSRLLDLLVR